MTKTVIVSNPPHQRHQTKRMRIIIEVDQDNTAAMFNRGHFNRQAMKLAALWNNPSALKVLGGPVVYCATEEVE